MQTASPMVHAGLPMAWVIGVAIASIPVVLTALLRPPSIGRESGKVIPQLNRLIANPWPQFFIRVVIAALFLLVIYAGIAGTPIPERNFATVVTWNFWWSGLILLVLFTGTAWCGFCPWDSIAQWLVRRRPWQRGSDLNSMNWQVPGWLRTVWPAAAMFVALTWLELGFGITRSPYGTAMLALLMIALATLSLALFERKAFCHYFCAVGRTIGTYSQLSPVALRPINRETCDRCDTLDCYHGAGDSEPCPTRLVMGRISQNTYCTTCGACVRSCPDTNVSWQLRGFANEIKLQARPHTDEAGFMLVLLALTSFHGITMLPAWEQAVSSLARSIGDSGSLLWSFSLLMTGFMLILLVLFMVAAQITGWISEQASRARLLPRLAFTAVPLAFAYHLAHNIGHLFRESGGTGSIWLNPTGSGTQPLSIIDIQCRMDSAVIFSNGIYALQGLLVFGGFYLAIQVLRHRLQDLYSTHSIIRGYRLLPMILFTIAISGLNLWLLSQPMVMRY